MNDKEQAPILIIGGTTEGRIAVQVCDEASKPFFYSTKDASQKVESANGTRLSGGLDREAMIDFCKEHNIGLIIDAAHPFAAIVHANIGEVASTLLIPVIRLERKFPPRDHRMIMLQDYDSALGYLSQKKIKSLLALTGVNSIKHLKPYWQEHDCIFRIMNRKESLAVVDQYGLPRDRVIFYEDERDEEALYQRLKPGAILTKESGESGGFVEKSAVALEMGIPLLVIQRPDLGYTPSATVYGKHGLRREVEALLPDFFELKTGYTTGSCATAATKAALYSLLTESTLDHITIHLPDDEPLTIPISATHFEKNGSVTCTVIKNSGDDPDVTNKAEICSNVMVTTEHDEVRFLQGEGVGRITLPGLGLEIGGPAINNTPRQMIRREVQDTLERYGDYDRVGVNVTISVPDGKRLAKLTYNPKLGIVDGISIIGTSGIVKPFSNEAFVNSIRREAQVAKAMGVKHLVINSGAKSERYLKAEYKELPPQAFVQYGNFIGETLTIAHEEGFEKVTLGIMIGKAVKLAEGLLDTHSKKAVMNKAFIAHIAHEAGCSDTTIAAIREITLARELWTIIPPNEYHFFHHLLLQCRAVCQPLFPNGPLTLLLMDDNGHFHA